MSASAWARRQFGSAAEDLVGVIPTAIGVAHDLGVQAQAAAKTTRRDTYGHTLKNTQHEQVVLVCRSLPGIEIFRPRGRSFEMVRVRATGSLIYPWRFATNASQTREQARMPPSAFRSALLHGDLRGDRQLLLDEHAHLDRDGLDAQLAEEAELLEQLNSLAPVAIVGFASDAKSLISLGWGEAVHTDAVGHLRWPAWESLPLPGTSRAVAPAGSSGTGPVPAASTTLRAVSSATTTDGACPALRAQDEPSDADPLEQVVPARRRSKLRFDDLPVPALQITARPVPQDHPMSEASPGSSHENTGTDASDSGGAQDDQS